VREKNAQEKKIYRGVDAICTADCILSGRCGKRNVLCIARAACTKAPGAGKKLTSRRRACAGTLAHVAIFPGRLGDLRIRDVAYRLLLGYMLLAPTAKQLHVPSTFFQRTARIEVLK
jgi:hypothetical protein